jgi:hypothetical protein
MSAHEEDRIQQLQRQALPPVEAKSADPGHDLWPAVLRRLDEKHAPESAQSWLRWVRLGSSWFDWALLAGVAAVTVAFPASIPLFLYYL